MFVAFTKIEAYLIVLQRYCACGFLFVLHKLKVRTNLGLSKSTGTIFQQHLLTLCVTFGGFSQYFKLFDYYRLCYGVL